MQEMWTDFLGVLRMSVTVRGIEYRELEPSRMFLEISNFHTSAYKGTYVRRHELLASTAAHQLDLRSILIISMAVSQLPCYISLAVDPHQLGPHATEKEEQIVPCSHSDFLSRYPAAPYTTFITLQAATKIPTLDFHCSRLLHGLRNLYPETPIPTHAYFRSHLLTAIRRLIRLRVDPGTELQAIPALVVLKGVIYLHVQATEKSDPRQNISPVIVECRGAPRQQPNVKNTSWYTERKPLETARGKDVSETILVDIDNEGCATLLEGLVTNIFMVSKNLHVFTAPDYLVLPGSKRETVLTACEQLAITVHRKPIRLADYKHFEAAFLTNVRKHLVPISHIRLPEPSLQKETNNQIEITLPSGSPAMALISRLRKLVSSYEEQTAVSITEMENIQEPEGLGAAS